MTPQTDRPAAPIHLVDDCAVCGQTDCTVGGLHGMIRDRAKVARQTIATRDAVQSPFTRRALARTLPAKIVR